MNKEVISNKQGMVLLILFIQGSTVVVGTGGEAKKDVWLAIIIGMILSFPMLFIYAKLISMFPGKDIFDISVLVLGKLFGTVANILFIWFAIHVGSLALNNFADFVNNIGLPRTPREVMMACIMFLCIWGVKEGIEVLGRWAEFLFNFLNIMLFLTITLSIQNININKILPIMENGVKPLITGAFSAFSFPFAETVIFTMIFSSLKDKKAVFKTYMMGVIITGLMIFTLAIRNVMVLGEYVISISFYAGYITVSLINIANFLQRLESVVSIAFLITCTIKISICLFGASKGVSKLFNFKDYRFIVVPIALIIYNLGFLVVDDIMELKKWSSQIAPYYKIPFEIILPVIIFIAAKIKYKKINIYNSQST
ncbi:endospore germination permease [Clostridium sp. SYSU_GA19001]|uniref:GerAB/ArcD/ProY family transporter n=1 Tax=Clostridium caldaquaticum TaxID=2940653 RepID=UPI0020778737|nr:endospore germination permease [Clostridium caldaquaticum]MCM8709511.1 endospore germination permease [Clostridium caldaquaticum]